MAVNRSVLIEKLLNGAEEEGDGQRPSTSHAAWDDIEAFEATSSRLSRLLFMFIVTSSHTAWDDIEAFEADTFREVESKLAHLDNLIWGKLIVMEGNTRTAKAYLRGSSVKVDCSRAEFDGVRFGLRRYSNPARDEITEDFLDSLSDGLTFRIDSSGNVWARTGSHLTVWTSRGLRSEKIGPNTEAKVFDLRDFKSSLLGRGGEDGGTRRRNLAEAAVYVKCSPAPALSCPLWFCLVHLIAVELTTLLHPLPSTEATNSNASSSSPSSSPPSSSSSSSLSTKEASPCPPPLLPSPQYATPPALPMRHRPLALDHAPEKPLPIPRISPRALLSSSPACSSPLSGSDRLLLLTAERGRSSQRSSSTAPRREASCGPLLPLHGDGEKGRGERETPFEKANQHGQARNNRGGVKKRLDRSSIAPFVEARSRGGAMVQTPRLSSSVVDLRSLDCARRPAYFCSAIATRGGPGHVGAERGRNF